MIGSARTANFDTHSYLKLKRKLFFVKVRGHISMHLSEDYYLNIIFILCKYYTGCITEDFTCQPCTNSRPTQCLPNKYQRLYVKGILRLVLYHLVVNIKVEQSELEPSSLLQR